MAQHTDRNHRVDPGIGTVIYLDFDAPSSAVAATYPKEYGIIERENGSYYITKTTRILLCELGRYVPPRQLKRFFSNTNFRHGLKRYLRDCLLLIPIPFLACYVQEIEIDGVPKHYPFGLHPFGLNFDFNTLEFANSILTCALFDYIGHAETIRRRDSFYDMCDRYGSHISHLRLDYTGFDLREFNISEILTCLFKGDIFTFFPEPEELKDNPVCDDSQEFESTKSTFPAHSQYDNDESIEDVVTVLNSLKVVDQFVGRPHNQAHQQGFCVIMNFLCDRDFGGKIKAIADELFDIQYQELDYEGILSRARHGKRIAQYDEDKRKDTCRSLAEREFIVNTIPRLSDPELCELFRQLLFYYPKPTGDEYIDLHNRCLNARSLELILYTRKDLYELEFKPLIYEMLHDDTLGCEEAVEFGVTMLCLRFPEERALATMDYLLKSDNHVIVTIADMSKGILVDELAEKNKLTR